MQLKTKFNLGDQVWFLVLNKAICSIVQQIKVCVSNEGTEIVYGCHPDKEQTKPHIYARTEEERTFASKQDLLNSL